MIEELENNIETEIAMLREIANYSRRVEHAQEFEKRLLNGAIDALKSSIKIINNSIPYLIQEIEKAAPLPSDAQRKKSKQKLEKVKFKHQSGAIDVVLNTEDRERFLRELSVSERLLQQLKKRENQKGEKYEEFKAARGYLKLANRLFLHRALKSIKKGKFKELSVEIRKANIEILYESYIAMIYFSVLLAIIFSVLLTAFLLFFKVGLAPPFLSFYDGDYLLRFAKIFWILLALPLSVFGLVYIYPSTEKKSLARGIDQELPFAVIHMSAISGSGIEPSAIFRIIGLNREYPYLRKEIRKILNQINLYGYDLITSLNNASKTAPSENLVELFSGLSTTISSGANLSDFFEKRSENLLLTYRLEREKYTKVVETFLDIYISIVIAAPMIFLLLLVMISISGIQVGLSSSQLGIVSVLGIGVLNLFFIMFLQLRQPGY